MKRTTVLLALLVTLVASAEALANPGARMTFAVGRPGVELVRPSGALVRGQWQRWALQAKVPTVDGAVVMTTNAFCGHLPATAPAQGCSSWSRPWLLYASDRDALYFELGHIFDRAVLTSRDRATFARIWGAYGHPWDNTYTALEAGREDGLAADFAAAYQACALGQRPQGLAAGDAPAIRMGNTCALIARLR